ncbi:hypothetical protein OCK74_25200 [Chitinophagaceae bacterium LB-8]|uniref:Uncharacterized protein n=1 Tax=Paraflavisolibacter caeni TaxID=2982496 RepID=A0A9X3BAA5_9BACT|nr:hypothetical protein [Paraflavisolibacter caeni]MCU7552441.1 hypothetical protein [Paraflavisolibacter caeni]
MEQQLPDKSNGLLLITGNDDKKIEIKDLNIYNHYHYIPSQIQQAADGNLIMPYMNNKEVGLMKIKLD